MSESGDISDVGPTKERSLNLRAFIFIAFFCVCGGPFAIEDLVGASKSPFWALLGILIAPWVFSLPIALMTAELSTRLPENGGYVIWVQKAFGPYWGFQEGYWSMLNGFADQALYPVMFVDYLQGVWGEEDGFTESGMMWMRLGVVVFVVVVNILGLDVVDKMSTLFGCIVLSPFIILIFMALPKTNPSIWFSDPTPVNKVEWGLYLSVVMWNNSGWESVGCLAGEVKQVRKTFPRGMVVANFMISALYFLVVGTFVCVDTDYKTWEEGTLARSAEMIGGYHMRVYVVGAALLSTLGLFQVILCTTSWMLAAMADPELMNFPPLAYESTYFKTPYVAVIINGICTAGFTFLPFQELVQVSLGLYGIATIPEFAALFYFRLYGVPDDDRSEEAREVLNNMLEDSDNDNDDDEIDLYTASGSPASVAKNSEHSSDGEEQNESEGVGTGANGAGSSRAAILNRRGSEDGSGYGATVGDANEVAITLEGDGDDEQGGGGGVGGIDPAVVEGCCASCWTKAKFIWGADDNIDDDGVFIIPCSLPVLVVLEAFPVTLFVFSFVTASAQTQIISAVVVGFGLILRPVITYFRAYRTAQSARHHQMTATNERVGLMLDDVRTTSVRSNAGGSGSGGRSGRSSVTVSASR